MWRHFKQDRCLEEAASLGYTSLLAIVPLLAVVFAVASAFPVFARWKDQLQSFIFDNFVPAAGAQIESYITGFLDSVGRLTLPGTFFLIVTALLFFLPFSRFFHAIMSPVIVAYNTTVEQEARQHQRARLPRRRPRLRAARDRRAA